MKDIKTIFKGFHRPLGLPAFLCPTGRLRKNEGKMLTKLVTFTDNCTYEIKKEKQGDWNKLFGVCFGILGIHRHSIRFGWRWNISKQKIEICYIIYDGKRIERTQIAFCDCELNREYHFNITWILKDDRTLDVTFHPLQYDVEEHLNVPIKARRFFGCGFYFGGKTRAPHRITAKLQQISKVI